MTLPLVRVLRNALACFSQNFMPWSAVSIAPPSSSPPMSCGRLCSLIEGILPTGVAAVAQRLRQALWFPTRKKERQHMRVKHLAVSITAAAVMGAFGSAFSQTSSDNNVNVNPNVGVDANVGIGNSDVNAGANVSPGVNVGNGSTGGTNATSSGVTANQSSSDQNSTSTINQGASTTQSSSTSSGSPSAASGSSSSTSLPDVSV